MSVNTDVLHELGVDYITCVAKEAGGWHQLKSTAFELLRVEEKKGNKVSGFGMAGFTGFKCGGVQVGQRDEEFLCRLSSEAAQVSWRSVKQFSDNVSRLDLQATVRVESGPSSRIERERRAALRHAASQKGKRVVQWVR